LARTPGCAGLVEAPGSSLETTVKDVVMLDISISRELAAEHARFLTGCAERGHQVQVFGTSREQSESDAPETRDPEDMPEAARIGQPDAGA
jgi:hypothetical protein